MGLPVSNEVVSFSQTELPSGKKLGIKPWKVKEEKELLFAIEGEDDDAVAKKEIVKMIGKCVDNPTVFKSLSNVDYVALLIELRKISKGATIEYTYKCTNPKCRFELSDDVNLNKHVIVKKYEGGTHKVNDKLSIILKEVSFEEYDRLKQTYTKTTEYNYNFVIKSIEAIVEDGELYSEFTTEEITDKIDTLSSLEYKALSKKIDESLSTIELSKSLTCQRCKTEMDVKFGDLYHFLAF
jgi:hypothetical protein